MNPLLRSTVALLLASALAGAVRAASVSVPGFSTSASSPTLASRLSSSTTRLLNLNDRTGLTSGEPISIRVTSREPMLWTGTFNYSPGPVVLDVTGTLGLFAGQSGASVSRSFLHFDFTAPNENGAVTDVSGFNFGDSFNTLELLVPWETDLSAVQLVLSQEATATNGGFRSSDLHTSVEASSTAQRISTVPFQIEVTSIPEPSVVLLGLSALSLLLGRSRAKETGR